MPTFETWDDDKCRGCGAGQEAGAEDALEPFYLLECSDPDCAYEGCHTCMPLGRGSRCEDCVDPETGE